LYITIVINYTLPLYAQFDAFEDRYLTYSKIDMATCIATETSDG